MKKNIRLGKIELKLLFFVFFLSFNFYNNLNSDSDLEGIITEIKVLDKISSKNVLIKLKNGDETRHKDLSIRSMKCRNSKFDDNPEITSYLQVKDINNQNNNEVFVFNGWTFSSSPSIQVFDHPVYDLWILKCY